MAELNERFRGIDRLSPPDLWEAARVKADAGVTVSAHPSGWRRAAIIAASLAVGLAAVAWVVTAIRPTTSPPVTADQPILSPAPRTDCPTGLVRTANVSTDEFVRLTKGYLPTWMPEGFGVLATYGPEAATADGYGALGIWSDEHCREVEYMFNPNWVTRSPDYVDPAASVGPWVVDVDVNGGCGNGVLGEARCLRYSAGTVDGLLSLSMMGLDREEGDRIALSIYGEDDVSVSPLNIRVWTTEDPADLHFSASFEGESVDLVSIETPGPDLEYPTSQPVELPVGTPIVVEASEGMSVSVFELDPAQGEFVVEDGSCLIPGSLRVLPGPDETAFFIYVEGDVFGGGQAFRAETIGDALDHDSALDPSSDVDASKLGLAFCGDGTSTTTAEEATSLPGIDSYKVCRVLPMAGDFGEAGEEVVVFEEERVPGAGCVGSEGFQHVAVLRDGRVTALSRRITDVYPDEVWKVWPYATPDLNGDGVNEIAVALVQHETNRRVWFFMLGPGGGSVDGIYDPREPFTHVIGDAGPDPTSFEPRGIYCEGNGDDRRIVTWEASGDGMLDVTEMRWHLETFRAVFDSETTIHIGEKGYPDAGDTELCGSWVSPREAYP